MSKPTRSPPLPPRSTRTADSPFVALLNAWPNARAISDDLHIPYYTVAAWFRRQYVAQPHWEALAAAARERGLRNVNYNRFRLAAAERQHRLNTIGDARSAAQDALKKKPREADLPKNREQTHAT